MTSLPVELDRLDHFVLTVRDIDKTSAFYERVFGMRREDYDDGRVALHFGKQKINLHPNPSPIEPKAAVPVPGSADFCLVASLSAEEIARRLQSWNVDVELGPVSTVGAQGSMRSVYFRDPDSNLVEVACYPSV